MASIGKRMKCLVSYKDIRNDEAAKDKSTLGWRNYFLDPFESVGLNFGNKFVNNIT